MTPIDVFILEDNHQTRQKLIELVAQRPEFRLMGSAATGENALSALSDHCCELLLLDIHLPDMSGINVLEKLKKIPHVIFITAFDKYALKAFDVGAIDYLLKPFSKERFNKSIDRFLSVERNTRTPLRATDELGFSFKNRGEHFLFAFDDIRFISSKGKHTILHTIYRDFDIAKLMKHVSEKLPDKIFLRIHKQFIINTRHISRLEHLYSGHYQIHLKGDDTDYLPVGRSYISKLKKFMQGA